MELFKWDNKYIVGFQEIDNQHKIIFDILNQAYDAFMKNEHEQKLDELLKRLTDYTDYHFKTEDNYFKRFPDDSIKEHLNQHELFKQKINKFKEQYIKDKKGTFYLVIKFIKDWFVNHINSTDKNYFSKLKQ